MRGQACTSDELRRRSLSCQRQRQKLLRAAVENSTSRWAQQVFRTRCSLPELAHLWRQQTGGGCDFDRFAHRLIRRSRSRIRSPAATAVGSKRRSASEPRLWSRLPSPVEARRRHSVVLPGAVCSPYVCVTPAGTEPFVDETVGADEIKPTQSAAWHHGGGQQMQEDYSGVPVVEGLQQMCLVPHAVPLMVLCSVQIAPEKPAGTLWGMPALVAGEKADKWTQTDEPWRNHRRHSVSTEPQMEARKFKRSRTQTLPGNFAELEKSWTYDGNPVKMPSRNLRV